MAAQDAQTRAPARAALLPAPPRRRVLAWIHTGPLGHLWSTAADVVSLWIRWGLRVAGRRAVRAIRSGRSRRTGGGLPRPRAAGSSAEPPRTPPRPRGSAAAPPP